MKKKLLSFIFAICLIIPAMFMLSACENSTTNVYTVNFFNDDGTLICSNQYKKGETISIPQNPTKLNDNQYSYHFAGWDKEVIQEVSASVDYHATYTEESNYFNIKILNYKECSIKPKTDVLTLPETVIIPDSLYDTETKKYYEVTVLDEEILDYSLNINVKDIYIPRTIKTINGSFQDFSYKLTNVYYNGTVRDWCSVNIGSPENPFCEAEHFFFISEADGEYEELKNLVIPEDVVSIGAYQFQGFDSIESVEFECYEIKYIGDHAFADCDNLKKIYFAQANIWNYWSDIKFDGNTIGNLSSPFCNNIEHVYIFNWRTEQYDEMIDKEISINKNVGYGQFAGCKFIDSIKIGGTTNGYSGYVTVGMSAFSGIGQISLLHIGENVVSYEQNAFHGLYVKTLILDSEYLLEAMISSYSYSTEVIYINDNIHNEDIEGFTKQATSDKTGYNMYIRNAK